MKSSRRTSSPLAELSNKRSRLARATTQRDNNRARGLPPATEEHEKSCHRSGPTSARLSGLEASHRGTFIARTPKRLPRESTRTERFASHYERQDECIRAPSVGPTRNPNGHYSDHYHEVNYYHTGLSSLWEKPGYSDDDQVTDGSDSLLEVSGRNATFPPRSATAASTTTTTTTNSFPPTQQTNNPRFTAEHSLYTHQQQQQHNLEKWQMRDGGWQRHWEGENTSMSPMMSRYYTTPQASEILRLRMAHGSRPMVTF